VLVVTDADKQSFPFHYDIVDGNHDNKFRISKDGYLSTASQFDKAVKDTYQLTVRVFDNADSPLFSDAVVTVRVVEESGYPPLISPLNISILVFDGRFVGGIIGRLKAISRYPHDFLTYSVVSSSSKHRNPFSVQQLDGTLLASDELETGVYTVNISVTNGRQTAYSEVVVTLRDVEPSAIDNSVIVRLGGLVPEEFILDLKSRFLRVLGQELGAADDGVMILSVQPSAAPQHTTAGQTRSRRDTTDEGRDLDVVLAARRPDNNFFKRSALKKKIQISYSCSRS
jgi:protocadherin Fat 1/2/3